MRTSCLKKSSKGFFLVEIVVSAAIISVITLGLFVAYNLYFNIALKNTAYVQATFLAEEGIEAVKVIRDSNWNTITAFTNGTPYYLSLVSNMWQASVTPVAYIDGTFERKIIFEAVLRDSSTKDISLSGDSDVNTRKVTSTVSWIGRNHATTSVSFSTYITNIHD